MYISVNGALIPLTDEQMETACRRQTLRQLETVAQEKLNDYISKAANQNAFTCMRLHPMAIYAPWHIDYIAHAVAKRFCQLRKAGVTNNITWKRAIEKELAAQKKLFAAMPEGSFGRREDTWLLRPLRSVLRHGWDSRLNGTELAFCPAQPDCDEPEDLFRFSYAPSDSAYCAHLRNPKSYLMFSLEPEEVYHPTFEAFSKEVRDLLKSSIYCKGKALPKWVWVRQYTGQ